MRLKKFKYYKYCIVFIALFLFIPAKVYAISIPQPTQEFYVNDFADVLTDEEEKQMLDKAVNLASEELGIQVVVTTIKSLDGESIENYAHDMYNQYGIGKDDMGVLILLSTEDRDTRIELGTAMEAYITDSKAGRILDQYAIPHFKENKFNSGLVSVQGAVIDEASTIKSQMEERAKREEDIRLGRQAVASFFKGFFKIVGWILLFGTPIGIIVYLVYRAIKKEQAKNDELESLRRFKSESTEIIERLRREKDSIEDDAASDHERLQNEISDLRKDKRKLEQKLDDAQMLYPDLEEELNKYYVKDFNSDIEDYIGISPSASLVTPLAGIINKYNSLPYEQKKYVTSSYSKIQSLYDKSQSIKIEEERVSKNNAILATVLGIIGAITVGKNANLSKLKSAMSMYNSLDEDFKSEFGTQNLGILKTLLSQAEKDHKRILREEEEEERRRKRREEEEEEEIRRRQRMSSSSSSSSSSSFHGFGGHSSGGGASRHF